MLRLLRPLLGDDAYRLRNVELRDAGRALARLRDAQAMLDAIDAVAARCAAKRHTATIAGFRQALAHGVAAAREEVADAGVRRRCAALIEPTRAQLDRVRPVASGAALGDGRARGVAGEKAC